VTFKFTKSNLNWLAGTDFHTKCNRAFDGFIVIPSPREETRKLRPRLLIGAGSGRLSAR
jgi:hypothetical protein